MGKWFLHASSFIFDRIIIKVSGNQDRRKSSVEFDFRPDQTTHFGVTCPSMTKFYTFELEYLWGQLTNLDQILCVASLGAGKGCIMFWGRLDQNSGVHGNRKHPFTYNGENYVSTFSLLLLIRSFLYLQVTRTCINSRMSSNVGQIRPLTVELAALERLKDSHRLIMGKRCLHASTFIFYRIIIKVAGNQDRRIARSSLILGRIRTLILELLALEWWKFHTFELEYLWSQLANLDQILCVASLGWGKNCIRFWGRLDQNHWFPWQQKAPIDL